jgi:hypothetical protein
VSAFESLRAEIAQAVARFAISRFFDLDASEKRIPVRRFHQKLGIRNHFVQPVRGPFQVATHRRIVVGTVRLTIIPESVPQIDAQIEFRRLLDLITSRPPPADTAD